MYPFKRVFDAQQKVGLDLDPGPQIRVCNWKLFSYFSTKLYVVGTQKNCLNTDG